MEDGEVGGRIRGQCEVCQQDLAKYRCPGCDQQSCSLRCVQEHKRLHSCTGKRSRAAAKYLPVTELTPEIILDDYWLLEDAAASAHLLAKSHPPQATLKRPQRAALVKRCAERNIHLALMPAEMARARHNQTQLRGDRLFWTIEWILLDSGGLKDGEHPANLSMDALRPHRRSTLYSRACEEDSLQTSYQNLLAAHPNSDHLPSNPAEVTLLLFQEADQHPALAEATPPPPPPLSPHRRLWPISCLETCWRLLLTGRTVIEFPSIYIYHHPPR